MGLHSRKAKVPTCETERFVLADGTAVHAKKSPRERRAALRGRLHETGASIPNLPGLPGKVSAFKTRDGTYYLRGFNGQLRRITAEEVASKMGTSTS